MSTFLSGGAYLQRECRVRGRQLAAAARLVAVTQVRSWSIAEQRFVQAAEAWWVAVPVRAGSAPAVQGASATNRTAAADTEGAEDTCPTSAAVVADTGSCSTVDMLAAGPSSAADSAAREAASAGTAAAAASVQAAVSVSVEAAQRAEPELVQRRAREAGQEQTLAAPRPVALVSVREPYFAPLRRRSLVGPPRSGAKVLELGRRRRTRSRLFLLLQIRGQHL